MNLVSYKQKLLYLPLVLAALFKNVPFTGSQLNEFGLLSIFGPALGNSNLRPGGAAEIFEVLLELLADFHVFYKASFFVF